MDQFLKWFLTAMAAWVLLNFSIFGTWMLIRSHYIRKFKREEARMSPDDSIFATVQEFRSELS